MIMSLFAETNAINKTDSHIDTPLILALDWLKRNIRSISSTKLRVHAASVNAPHRAPLRSS